ncbi:MAG: hypothetical protein C0596_01395 [Marinilabiliales bacterium]|nr:MAG: hypothetical protein C0596_01395 [Marinilabiliales bacterium]
MKIKSLLVYAGLSVLLASCGIGKSLEKPAYIKIQSSVFQTYFDTEINKYLNQNLENEYLSALETELESSLKTYNIYIINAGTEPSGDEKIYVLDMKNMTFTETYEAQSVYMDSMATSPEYFEVVTCDIDISGDLYKFNSRGEQVKIKTISLNVDKGEKLSNSRTFWQIIFGNNKDNSEYTYKELDENVFYSLSEKAARHMAAKTSRTLYKDQ